LIEAKLAAWRAHYAGHLLDHTQPYPGVGAALASARCALAVHTNKPGAMARRILEGLGVLGRFGAVVGGDEAPRKPDPTGTLEIAARLGVRPEETVFVGDSRVDQETAAAAGIRFLAVTWGFLPAAALAGAGAAAFARDAAEPLLFRAATARPADPRGGLPRLWPGALARTAKPAAGPAKKPGGARGIMGSSMGSVS
jgi:phosphoglycolate phosphatase